MEPEVFLLDGNQRSALSAVRSLGKQGINVHAGEQAHPSISCSSKYASCAFLYPSPYTKPDSFIEKIQELSVKNAGAILLPMTDVTVSEILRNKEKLRNFNIPMGGYEAYEKATDKATLFRLAKELDIPIPDTLFSDEYSGPISLVSKASVLGFPLVIKPSRSRFRLSSRWVSASVQYATDEQELRSIIGQEKFSLQPFLLQEKVEGPGVGIFLLVNEGESVAHFAHRRIREKPPSGGVSVLCESIAPPEKALQAAKKLMKHIGWTGPAMVEFKWDKRINEPKLMEVNARFWGSLELAISAGVDFPYLLYRMATGARVDPPKTYRIGLRSRWELGDLDHLLIRLRHKDRDLTLPEDAPSRSTVLFHFIRDFFHPSVRHEVFRPDDPRPFFFVLKQYLRQLSGKLRVKGEK